MGPETLYFFFDDQDRCLNVVDGVITASSTPRPLEYAPDGWQDISIQNQRNQKYFAMDRSFTVPLEFVEDGAQILKDRYYTKGIEEKVFLVIMKQQLYFSDTEYGFYYTLLYRGEIDFSQLKHKGEKVTANIMEGGAAKYLKANETIKYEIPVDADSEAIKIKMDGILFTSTHFFFPIGNPIAVNPNFGTVFTQLIRSESTPFNAIVQTQEEVLNVDATNVRNTDAFLFQPQEATAITIKFRLKGHKTAGVTTGNVIIGKSNTTTTSTIFSLTNVYYVPGANPSRFDSGHQEFIVNMAALEKIQFFGILYQMNYDDESYITISYDSKYRTSFIKALRPKRLYQQLVSKVTDGTIEGESNALETYKTFAVTCGDAIRGIAGSVIKSSKSDFFQSFNTILSIGMGPVNGKMKLERKPDWIDTTDTIDLGEGKDLIVSPALDYIFNSLKIGYPNQDYEDVNGKQEFNTTHIYTAPVTRVNKELDLTSVYRADCYGIEFTRINLEGKTTTDSSSDNDTFVIHIKATPIIDPVEGEVYELDRTLNQYATGLITPETVFNLALSPKQCLLRNGQYLRSCFYRQDTGYLKFQTTDKNSAVVVAAPSGTITENGDIQIADLGDRLFVPVLLEFDTRVPIDLLELLAVNPLQSFLSSYLEAALKGIPVKVGIKPEDNEAQTYQLLASADCDLEPLIDIYE